MSLERPYTLYKAFFSKQTKKTEQESGCLNDIIFFSFLPLADRDGEVGCKSTCMQVTLPEKKKREEKNATHKDHGLNKQDKIIIETTPWWAGRRDF